ncbi:MAG TPA: hypothetical protein VKR26_18225 [Terriglobales bacterium]|nr:hypothetical protein [Terriglobales bacterium]
MRILLRLFVVVVAVSQYGWSVPAPRCSQGGEKNGMPQSTEQRREHCHMPKMAQAQPGTSPLAATVLEHTDSGTSLEPGSIPVPMLMTTAGKWRLMFHGEAFLNELQQSGPRGADKLFSTSWFMPMAQRHLGPGQLTVRAMFSLEPATVSERRYPELFQEGETAYGRPIVDGQHPHDLFMELAAFYDLKLSGHALLSFYGGPVGDPAMGPTAYPHRASASENPMAPLGHHLEDSTHIADDVITAGLTYRKVRFEASGFHGREPDEDRWDMDAGRIDSWSTRVTVSPAQNWSVQYSIAHLTSPEAIRPGEDVRRMTASVMYNRPLGRGNWASTLLWGRNSDLNEHQIGNGYLAESTLHFLGRNNLWGRVENVDRTSDLLLDGAPLAVNAPERFLARVQAYTAGYDREFAWMRGVSSALGGQVTFYGKPAFLTPIYGAHPLGFLLFLRFRPAAHMH